MRHQETGWAHSSFRVYSIVVGLNQNLKLKRFNEQSTREARPWRQPQLPTPLKLDDQRTEQRSRKQHAADTSQAAISLQPIPWPMGPSPTKLGAAVQPKIVCCGKCCCCLSSTRTLSRADLALQNTGAITPAA